ncbi:MAG: DUF1512 domain-containing protein [Candidatus Helarchaeota archaeon]|nr:DUF1512 domain-containing protein [Candidatus Helarchaeota archaeon]
MANGFPSIPGLTPETDYFAMILQIVFYVFFFIFMFYGQRIQMWTWLKTIENAVAKLQYMAHEGREITIHMIKNIAKAETDPRSLVGQFLEFFIVQPVEKDPAGVIRRLEHVLDVRESRFKDQVKILAPNVNKDEAANIENTLEAALSVNLIYRIVKHFYLLGKKTKSMMVIMQIQMQLSLILRIAKAIMEALKAFSQGKPIGDGLGPLVIANLYHKYKSPQNEPKTILDYTEDITVHEMEIEDRHAFLVRATGPGARVGKPGQAVQKLMDEYQDRIKRLFMIDAGLKLEGEKSGDVIEGVGAVIGGPGVEKYKIEESGVKYNLPMDGYVVKESAIDAYGPMKQSISKSVNKVIEFLKNGIQERTEKGDTIIICGVGNTVGIG